MGSEGVELGVRGRMGSEGVGWRVRGQIGSEGGWGVRGSYGE